MNEAIEKATVEAREKSNQLHDATLRGAQGIHLMTVVSEYYHAKGYLDGLKAAQALTDSQ